MNERQLFHPRSFIPYGEETSDTASGTACLKIGSLSILTGLPVPAVPAGLPSRPRKTPAKKRKTLSVSQDGESSSESSDDSDEDWVPGSEEVRRRNKMIKRFIPGS